MTFTAKLYEFNRNTDYDANNYFMKLAGQPRPEFQLNEPGGNIGGPLCGFLICTMMPATGRSSLE